MLVALRSMQGQKALQFHQKYKKKAILCVEGMYFSLKQAKKFLMDLFITN